MLIEEVERSFLGHTLSKVIRAEICVFVTPAEINGDLQPTDHRQLLLNGLYPLAKKYGAEKVREELENALIDSATDALGAYCALQCYYSQIIAERANESPFKIDRVSLPKTLNGKLKANANGLQELRVDKHLPKDAAMRMVDARIKILTTMFGIEFHSAAYE